MAYKTIKVPSEGDKITQGKDGVPQVSNQPIIPFIEGDGTGRDIWKASQYVFDNGIKGPLTTPVGGGIRSLNVALRQLLDLYVCLRPVRYFEGVPSPVKQPEKVDMVIFRENTEDIYAGIEYAAGTPEAQKILNFLEKEFPKEFKKIRFGTSAASKDWQDVLEKIGAPHRDAPVAVGV